MNKTKLPKPQWKKDEDRKVMWLCFRTFMVPNLCALVGVALGFSLAKFSPDKNQAESPKEHPPIPRISPLKATTLPFILTANVKRGINSSLRLNH